MRAAIASDVGGRVVQQDAVACFVSADRKCHLLVLADGMGGHAGGELASAAVIEEATELWARRRRAPPEPHLFLETLCHQAHERIRRLGAEQGLQPRSTIAALLVTEARAWWVHVGDSRVYAFRTGQLLMRTEDHTVARTLIRGGVRKASALQGGIEQHMLLRGLGGQEPLRTTHGQMAMSAQTAFLLCTDGFWGVVDDQELSQVLETDDAQATCLRWVGEAARRGGAEGDNVALALLLPEGGAPPLWRRPWPWLVAVAVVALLAVIQSAG